MQTNILWTGREYHSLENCLVKCTDSGNEISSVIIGSYEGKIYKVEYRIKTTLQWETLFAEITSRHSNQEAKFILESDGNGNWKLNGKKAETFKGCMDIDIPLTPFTNTLPINRLQLNIKEEQLISVIYLDLLEQQIKTVRQKYTRLSASEYQYENVPNDFEAKITADESGLVIDYPGLFVRTAILTTN